MINKIIFLALLCISHNHYATWNLGNIHIFGDSHSAYSFTNIYSNSTPPTPLPSEWPLLYEKSFFNYQHQNELLSVPFYIHWINRSMHGISVSGLDGLDFRKFDVQNGDIALLHFGGIESYHGSIEKQYMKGRDLNEIIETLTKDFVNTILENQRLYDQVTIVIMAVLPPRIFAHNKDSFVQFTTSITFEEFAALTNRTLNDSLERHCKSNNFLYLNANSFFKDAIGILRPELSNGDHHVKPCFNYLIKEKLIKLILENNDQTKQELAYDIE